MPANLENSAVATGLEKVSFHFQSQRRAMPKNGLVRFIILSVKMVSSSHFISTLSRLKAWSLIITPQRHSEVKLLIIYRNILLFFSGNRYNPI